MQDATPVPTISENVIKFKETKNPYYLAKAIIMVISRGRTHELFYGIYCKWVHAPSKVVPTDGDEIEAILAHFQENILLYKREFLTKQQLQEIYGAKFAVDKLPEIFGGTRSESIIETETSLVLGEYDEDDNSSRIAMITADDCVINDYYMGTSGIRHIHSLHRYDDDKILVATGDRLKVLDLWSNKGGKLSYTKRLIRFLAGYTAMEKINGDFYFGTDYSSRPNYIEMEDRTKFFFPEPAYTMFVISFHSYQDRYLLSLNSSLEEYGNGKTLTIFDTKTKQFVYCDEVILPE